MKKNKEVVIEKKKGVLFWKIACQGVCPNTEVVLEKGLTLLVKINGESKLLAKEKSVLNSLVHPGKAKKIFGGNKPYASCEMFVFDQSTEFTADWELDGKNSLNCKDYDFGEQLENGKRKGIDCNAIVKGSFSYKIDNFVAFSNSIKIDEDAQELPSKWLKTYLSDNGVAKESCWLSIDDVKEELKAEIRAIAKPYLSRELMKKGVAGCQENLITLSDEIKRKVSQALSAKGIVINKLAIEEIEYEQEHLLARKKLMDSLINQTISNVGKEGLKENQTPQNEQTELPINLSI